MMLRSELRKEWEVLVADYSRSRLSARKWCAANGVSEHQLEYWRRRIREKAGNVVWATIELVEEDAGACTDDIESGGITVHLGAARIEVRPGVDRALLGDVLRVVATC